MKIKNLLDKIREKPRRFIAAGVLTLTGSLMCLGSVLENNYKTLSEDKQFCTFWSI
jgi:hypothetical protein